MGKTTKKQANARVYIRKATFTKRKDGLFQPVNKRARKMAQLVGKRTRVTKQELRKIQSSGKVKVYLYVPVKGNPYARQVAVK